MAVKHPPAWVDRIYSALHPTARALPAPPVIDAPRAPGNPQARPIAADPITRPNLQPTDTLSNLRIVTCASVAATLVITGNVRRDDGSLWPIGPDGKGFEIVTKNTRAVETFDRGLPGHVEALNVACANTISPSQLAFCFVQETRIAPDGTIVPIRILVQGYVTRVRPRSFPGSPLESSIAGPGALRTILGSEPAAGVEQNESVPVNTRWMMKAIGAGFTTDATVIARRPCIIFNDGIANYGRIPGSLNQDASEFFGHTWTQSVALPIFAAIDFGYGPLPDSQFLQAGWSWRTLTQSFQGGDNWDSPRFLVEEWLDFTV